ncbi:MAG: hypothetical protein LBC52_07850 [Treponema sp.]|nr:hypothetical protein [Treponema sp.]
MKKLFLIIFCFGFLSSCFFLFNDREDPDKPDEPDDRSEKTLVVFDNTHGKSTVSVFGANNRNEKIADVPAKQLTGEIEYTSGTSIPFYFSYLIKLKNIYNFSFYFVPEYGKDQIWVPVYENKENKITVPKIEETLLSQNQLLSNDTYLLIQNDSTFPFRLQQGTSLIRPENSQGSDTVLAKEKALYKIRIMPESSIYQLLVNADNKSVPKPDGGYKAGILYWYKYNNTDVTLDSVIPIDIDLIDDTLSRFPPPNIKAAGISQTEIRLTWDAVPEAVGYQVYRGSGASSGFTLINSLATNTYTDTGMSPKTTLYYRVSTKDINGESEQSNALRASTLPVPVPTGLKAAPSGDGAVYLTWNYVPVATAYKVYRSRNYDGPYSLIETVTSTYYYDSGRASGYTFYYRVSSVMGSWESDWSGYASAKTE